MARMEYIKNNRQDQSKEDMQLHLKFNNEDFENLKKNKIEEINFKYPYAKLNPSFITRDENGNWLFRGKDLEKEAEIMHIAYAPDDKEDWTDI